MNTQSNIPRSTALLVTLLAALFAIAGCTIFSTSTASPPAFQIQVGDTAVDGYQAAYCWNSLCADGVPPEFGSDDYVMLVAGEPIQLQLESPLPDSLNVSLRDEVFGENLASTQIEPAMATVKWGVDLSSGSYILAVSGKWSKGDALTFFAVEIP